jgi:hypothetical protein
MQVDLGDDRAQVEQDPLDGAQPRHWTRVFQTVRACGTQDFRQWLLELAEEAEQAETLEQFLSQTDRSR